MTTDRSILDDLVELVSCESPSNDVDAIARCADVVDALAVRRIGAAAERVTSGGRVHLQWRFGRPRVLLLGHFDTVWPIGTLDRWPVSVEGDRLTGPGAFDMKFGLVQTFAALQQLDSLDGVAVLLTSDEEIGSLSSEELIVKAAGEVDAVLVLEASADGALKIARKGVGMFDVDVTGRAAHAGLEPEAGINASVELAHQVLAITELARPDLGTTVTPSLVSGGTTINTVPAAARIGVDVRAATVGEMERVATALADLTPRLPGARLTTTTRSVRMPFEPARSERLFALAGELAPSVGIPDLAGVAVGGGSDGNITAALGVPTLDGLGAVGGNAHAEGEWVSVTAMQSRIDLVAALLRRLSGGLDE
jgi:glutamate carboxypeptidase